MLNVAKYVVEMVLFSRLIPLGTSRPTRYTSTVFLSLNFPYQYKVASFQKMVQYRSISYVSNGMRIIQNVDVE